ncbi:class C beta-lactamase [Entomohabitans teleogrylli]|uniref:class C beta-lactamase n=1 Tax=Entomohabitans teleogrylli TaxID=1384589 RepID=UPI00073D4442|nr:class C beta-lactamase [Entomohabitans teleogrylli]
MAQRLRLFVGGALALGALPALSQPPDVAAVIRPLMAQYQIPGMAVGLSVNGQHYFYNFGAQSLASQQPVTEQTLFEIGSLSKTFTATLAGYAAVVGDMDFADPVSRYIPELRHSAFDRVSLLNLATHTSGLPLFVPDSVIREEQLLTWYRDWQPPAEPGTRRVYSNTGVGLLGLVAARSLDKPFTALMQQEMLPALGMSQSWIEVPESEKRRYAQGYNKRNQPVRLAKRPLDAESYGLKSTSADLLRWLDLQMRNDTLAAPWRQAINLTHTGYYRSGAFIQGMMWEYYPIPVGMKQLVAGNRGGVLMKGSEASPLTPPQPGARVAWYNKTGSTDGFSTYAVFIPAQNTALIMLANKWFPNEVRVNAAWRIIYGVPED